MKHNHEIDDKSGGDIFAHIHPVIALMLKRNLKQGASAYVNSELDMFIVQLRVCV